MNLRLDAIADSIETERDGEKLLWMLPGVGFDFTA